MTEGSKSKTTKVGMVWYELNIVNESVTKVGKELLWQLKKILVGQYKWRRGHREPSTESQGLRIH